MSLSVLHYGDNKNTEGLAGKVPRALRVISSSKIYHPMRAQRMAERRKRRFQKPRKLTPEVRTTVIRYLKKDLSPQQITGRLRALGKADVCHETIYEMIRRDKASGGKLYQHCRFQLKHINHWLSRKRKKTTRR
ncbi:helix-turn-helix domain-containing protein [Prevotella jejuni]|uniref:helix-turn-helix domain-containing protein n=1 Tax=Prevotella jejuni TaxID=1177574 RepID=UPI001C5FB5FD|nr:helix-turn-helix domain-containing protein [Prevotella jejuni]MBF1430724.1 helix-turn-helix domain-containing protein [Prevotella melaninogenica]MBW4770825.1 helix-turn-helix domain-containing protein [Prevotella jejuni]